MTHVTCNAPRQVIHMPTGLNNSHATTRHQTCTGTVGEPLVSLLEDLEVPVNHILFRVGIIHKK